jgi:hypothetical protein
MKATLKFSNYTQANDFAVAYKFHTLSSPIVSNEGPEGVTSVTIYNINEKSKSFINNYITKLNK